MPNRATAARTVLGTRLRSPCSRTRIELAIWRSGAVFGIVFGAQSVPGFVARLPEADPAWNVFVGLAVFASLLVASVLSFVRCGVRTAFVAIAVVYVIALATWPLAVLDDQSVAVGPIWLSSLVNVSAASAAIATGPRLAAGYLFAVSALSAVVRLSPSGGGPTAAEAILEAVFSLILGGAILVVIVMLRNTSLAVDSAQSAALESYAYAVRQHATEVERVQVDSIVHDSVLTTLLSAARARTPEGQQLSATMAHNAIGHLKSAALVVPDDGSTVDLQSLVARVAMSAQSMTQPFEIRTRAVSAVPIPVQSAEALHAAALQAMVNSIQHAGASTRVTRWVAIRGIGITGIEIEIGDTGEGFSFIDVPAERLGLRVSIIERVANAGGVAEIDSMRGEGTVITIRWPRPVHSVGALQTVGLA